MRLRRFTSDGLRHFEELLIGMKANPSLSPPSTLLTDPTFTTAISPPVEVHPQVFSDRMELGGYLNSLMSDDLVADHARDPGLWTWMTLLFFDQVCPADDNGQRNVGAQLARWIPRLDLSRRFYRHCLLGPYMAYRSHRKNPKQAAVLLADPLHITTSEAFRLFIETPFINMEAPVALATKYYYDPEKKKLRRGAGVKGPGGLRRFLAVIQQLDLTFDIHSLTVERLHSLLPEEFRRWDAQANMFG